MTDIPEAPEVESDTFRTLRLLLRDELRRQDVYVQFPDDDVWLVDGHIDVDKLIAAVVGPALLSERRKQIERDAEIADEMAARIGTVSAGTDILAAIKSGVVDVMKNVAAAIRAQQEPK